MALVKITPAMQQVILIGMQLLMMKYVRQLQQKKSPDESFGTRNKLIERRVTRYG